MDARTPHRRGPPCMCTIAKRAHAILDDEIAADALANIAAAIRAWSAHRCDLMLPEVTRRPSTTVGEPGSLCSVCSRRCHCRWPSRRCFLPSRRTVPVSTVIHYSAGRQNGGWKRLQSWT